MASDKEKNTKDGGQQLAAGVDKVAEREARAESREVAEVPAQEFAPEEDNGLTELPEGVILAETVAEGNTDLTVNAQLADAVKPVHQFGNDEHFGKGGTFAIDPKTGNRVPVYEEYIGNDGKKRYRPKP